MIVASARAAKRPTRKILLQAPYFTSTPPRLCPTHHRLPSRRYNVRPRCERHVPSQETISARYPAPLSGQSPQKYFHYRNKKVKVCGNGGISPRPPEATFLYRENPPQVFVPARVLRKLVYEEPSSLCKDPN